MPLGSTVSVVSCRLCEEGSESFTEPSTCSAMWVLLKFWMVGLAYDLNRFLMIVELSIRSCRVCNMLSSTWRY